MKKINIITIVFCILVVQMIQAQPYGHFYYNHLGSRLSSGTITTNSLGFLTAGYVPTVSTTGNPNFNVTKILAGNAGIVFDAEYKINGDGACSSLNNINDCAGVSVIEENSPGGTNYALTGAYARGVFFCMLDVAGVPSSFIQFPFPTSGNAPSKPLIIGGNTPGEYYITGSYYDVSGAFRRMYIVKVNSSGLLLGSKFYHMLLNGPLQPYDIILSPYSIYSSEEIVVVGAAEENQYTGYNFNSHGFFATFDGATLLNTSFHHYGQAPFTSPSQGDHFKCITVSDATGGYAIGGYSNANGGTTTPWAVNINATGTAFNWSWNYNLIGSSVAKQFNGIVERWSSFYNEYQYYLVFDFMQTPQKVGTMRLDHLGQSFIDVLAIPPAQSTFIYPTSVAGSGGEGVDIGFVKSTSPTDAGITLFANDDLVAGGVHHLGKAAFNGWDDFGCLPILNYDPELLNTPVIENPNLINLPGLNPCNTFSISVSYPLPVWSSNACNVPVLTFPANLNKSSLETSINELNKQNVKFIVLPNPAHDYFELNCDLEEGKPCDITITNALGQIIKSYNFKNQNGVQQIKVDVKAENLSVGVYFIKTNINGAVYQQKLIITN